MIKKLVCLAAALYGMTSVQAQIVFHSLNEVWTYADQHSITLRTAAYDYQKARLNSKISAGSILPQITASASGTDNTSLQTTLLPAEIFGGPKGKYDPVQFGQKYIYTGGYTAQLDILSLQNWLNVRITKETELADRDSVANYRRNVYQQLASQYYNYLLMQEAAVLAARSLSIADSVNRSMANKFSEGLVNKGNADVAEINYERSKQSFVTSQYQMLTAGNNLKLLLNLSPTDSVRIDDKWDRDALNYSGGEFAPDPGLRLAADQINITRLQSKSVESSLLPILTVQYSNTTQQNDNKYEPFASPSGWFPARYWQLKASWQIFNGGSRLFQVQKSRINLLEKQALYENQQKQVAINDANLILARAKAAELVQSSKRVMELQFDNYEHISNRYREGVNTLDDRLSAFSDYITYQNQYLNNLSDLLVQLYLIKLRQMDFK